MNKGRHSAGLAASVLLALVLALIVAPRMALAHALLLRSEPGQEAVVRREPGVIHLWFSEDLNSTLSKAVVWNDQRHQVDKGDDRVTHARELTVSLRPGLPNGTYLVLWTSVSSQDGHVLKGAYLFSVGHKGKPPAAPSLSSTSQNFPPGPEGLVSLVARGLELAMAGLWLGLALFLVVIAPTPARDSQATELAQATSEKVMAVMPIALVLLFLARSVSLIIQANVLAGDWATTFRASTFKGLLLDTEYGHIWIAFQCLVVVGLAVSFAAYIRRKSALATSPRAAPATAGADSRLYSFMLPVPRLSVRVFSPGSLLLTLALVAAYLLAASGHAATVNLNHTGTGILTVPVAIDWVHVLATGLWVGGIFAVSLALIPAFKSLSNGPRVAFLDTLDRFSPFAYASVLVLAATGGFNGKVHVPSWDAFFNAVYGRALIVKMVLVLLMIVISAFTVGIVRPRLRGHLVSTGKDERPVRFLEAVLVRWLRVGAVLGAGVFLATAVLNAYPVALIFGAPAGPFGMQTTSQGLGITLRLNPGRAGPNTFTVLLKQGGRPVKLAEVRIIETMLDMNMGTQYVIVNQKGRGVFKGSGQIAMGGHWQLEVLVRLPNRTRLVPAFFRPTVGG